VIRRRFSLILLSSVGVAHFVIGLGCWSFLLFWLFPRARVDIFQLRGQALFEAVVIPLSSCVVLLVGFLLALWLSLKENRKAELTVWATALLTVAAFLMDTEWSFAQIHFFGKPGTNHFFATWPLYTVMPYLSFRIRFATAFLALLMLSWFLWILHSEPTAEEKPQSLDGIRQ
jgi:hypothetical protein